MDKNRDEWVEKENVVTHAKRCMFCREYFKNTGLERCPICGYRLEYLSPKYNFDTILKVTFKKGYSEANAVGNSSITVSFSCLSLYEAWGKLYNAFGNKRLLVRQDNDTLLLYTMIEKRKYYESVLSLGMISKIMQNHVSFEEQLWYHEFISDVRSEYIFKMTNCCSFSLENLQTDERLAFLAWLLTHEPSASDSGDLHFTIDMDEMMEQIHNSENFDSPVLARCGKVSIESVKTNRKFDIEEFPFVIGRDSYIFHDEYLNIHENRHISRQHARMELRDADVFLEDLNSTNGTFVNGERISSDTPCKIKNGDIFRLADEDFRVTICPLQASSDQNI